MAFTEQAPMRRGTTKPREWLLSRYDAAAERSVAGAQKIIASRRPPVRPANDLRSQLRRTDGHCATIPGASGTQPAAQHPTASVGSEEPVPRKGAPAAMPQVQQPRAERRIHIKEMMRR